MKTKFLSLVKMLSTSTLAVAMLTAVPQQVFAQDTHEATTGIPEDAIVRTYELTLNPRDELDANVASEMSTRSYYPAETFTFQGVRRGADHYMDGNYMAYEVNIKMADGTTNNSIPVQIQIRKYSGSQVVYGWRTFHPDGITHKEDWISFTGGGTCYFEYANVCDGTAGGPVTVTLTTYSWN